MKKFLLAACLCLLLFISSGCTKDNYTIKIDKNNKITLTETLGISKADLSEIAETFNLTNYYNDLENVFKPCIKPNYEVIVYEDDNYKGITQTKDNINIEDFEANDLIVGLTPKRKVPITVKNGLLKDKYSIKLQYDRDVAENFKFQPELARFNKKEIQRIPTSIRDNEDGTVTITKSFEEPISVITPKPDVKLIIDIPVKAKKHNADNVLNNTYEWNLYRENPIVEINLEYEKWNGNSGLIIMFVSLIVLVAFLGIIFVKSQNDIGM